MDLNHALQNSYPMTVTSQSSTLILFFGKERTRLYLAGSTQPYQKKVLSPIYGHDTSRQVWAALANQFANQSKFRIANLKKQL